MCSNRSCSQDSKDIPGFNSGTNNCSQISKGIESKFVSVVVINGMTNANLREKRVYLAYRTLRKAKARNHGRGLKQ